MTHHISNDMLGVGYEGPSYEDSPGGWLGSAIEQVSTELLKVDDELSKQLKQIEQLCSRLTVAMNQVLVSFGDEPNGQALISKYYETIRTLTERLNASF